jgi:type VI secretion system FHA domain protein
VDQFLGVGGDGLEQLFPQLSDSTLPGRQTRTSQVDHVHDINLPFNPPTRKKPAAEVPLVAGSPPPSVAGADAFEGDIFDALMGYSSNPPSTLPASPAPASSPSRKAPTSFTDDLFSVLDGLIATPQSDAGMVLKPDTVESCGVGPSPVQVTIEGTSNEALIAKLIQGLNMPGLRIPPGDAPAFMLELGRMFRIAVEGIHGLLLLRAEIKKELRAEDRTMIASRENNPLKHTETIEEALQYLLAFGASNPAFLPPERAIEDAFKDIRAHEMAVMAGMRAGLSGVLKRFDPKSLEPRIKKTGALDSVLPTLYKAKLWDCYIEFYKDIEGEAEDHFDILFGREFVRAYMEQTKQLSKRGKR